MERSTARTARSATGRSFGKPVPDAPPGFHSRLTWTVVDAVNAALALLRDNPGEGFGHRAWSRETSARTSARSAASSSYSPLAAEVTATVPGVRAPVATMH